MPVTSNLSIRSKFFPLRDLRGCSPVAPFLTLSFSCLCRSSRSRRLSRLLRSSDSVRGTRSPRGLSPRSRLSFSNIEDSEARRRCSGRFGGLSRSLGGPRCISRRSPEPDGRWCTCIVPDLPGCPLGGSGPVHSVSLSQITILQEIHTIEVWSVFVKQ